MRSATQSVWYSSFGIGLIVVSGAPVSPPPSACSNAAKPFTCSGCCASSHVP